APPSATRHSASVRSAHAAMPDISSHAPMSTHDGMRQLTRKNCDELVSIPMKGAVESLNVSVASGVCLYEALRQRT
ncbi:TrmH family RNA methyltransferase, partial [Acidovorax sp. NPDC077664]|uniref:TrmH family RNA methyltransferase n=1 Tax=Acidovorax sp. NPDC077664 TaxID=3390544 RepID=UPI003CFDDD47